MSGGIKKGVPGLFQQIRVSSIVCNATATAMANVHPAFCMYLGGAVCDSVVACHCHVRAPWQGGHQANTGLDMGPERDSPRRPMLIQAGPLLLSGQPGSNDAAAEWPSPDTRSFVFNSSEKGGPERSCQLLLRRGGRWVPGEGVCCAKEGTQI